MSTSLASPGFTGQLLMDPTFILDSQGPKGNKEVVQKVPYSYFNIFLSAHTSLPLLCGPQNPELQKQLLLPAKLPTGRGPRQAPSVHTFCLLLLKASAGLC